MDGWRGFGGGLWGWEGGWEAGVWVLLREGGVMG